MAVLAVSGCVAMAWFVVTSIGADDESASHEHRHHSHVVDPETSCGPVSLAVISHLLDRPVAIADLHAATRASDLGYCSMADLRRAMEEHGFAASAVRYDPRHPPGHRSPLVLFLDEHHFVAALPAAEGRVVIVDPPAPPTMVRWSTLETRWSGEALVVGRSASDVHRAVPELAAAPPS